MRRNWVVLALTEESVLGRNVARRRAAAILLAAIRANKQFGSAPALLDNVPTPIVGSVADELRVLIAAHGLAEAAI